MGKTILITGGAGYIGSHVGFYCAQQGYHIIILDNLTHMQQCAYPWATFVYGSCTDQIILAMIFSRYTIDAVIHCAASIDVAASVRDPLAYYTNNVSTLITLLQAMHTAHCTNIIFCSSAAVYGIPHELPMTETHLLHPVSPYGTTKKIGEQILHDTFCAYGITYIAFRFFNVAGTWPESGLKEEHQPETHIIPLLLRAIHTGQPFYIYGTDHPTPDGTAVRDYVHVWDIARAHWYALNVLAGTDESYCINLGGGTGTSVQQLIDMVQRICNKKITIVHKPARPGDPPTLVADISKAHRILNWQPNYTDLAYMIETAYTSGYSYQSNALGKELYTKKNNLSR